MDRNSASQLATPDSTGPAHLPPQTESASSEHLQSAKRPSLLDDAKKDCEGGSEGVGEGGDGGRRGGGRSKGEGEAVSAKAPPIKKPRLMGPSLPPRQKRDKFEPQVSDETRPTYVYIYMYMYVRMTRNNWCQKSHSEWRLHDCVY